MKEQDSVITVRDLQIKELQEKLNNLKKEYTKSLEDIVKQNQVVKETSEEEDKITDSQIKTNKLKWDNLRLYIGFEFSDFKDVRFNSELMYELRKIHFGVKLQTGDYLDKSSRINFKIRYNIF